MDKTDLKKLEDITREIIETLDEEMPEDKSGLLCVKNRNSPFRQLVGLLEMEMDSIRIMYSDLPLPAIAAEEKESRKTPEETETPIQKEPTRNTEPPRPKFSPRPASDKPREPVTTSEPLEKQKSASARQQATEQPGTANDETRPQPAAASNKTTDQNFAATAKIKPLSSPPASPNPRNNKFLLAAGVVILLLLAGLIMLRKEPTQQQPAKVVVNWSDVEKGKTHASELKDKVTPQSKKQAKSFYTLGNKELGNKNLRAAREYFRTAVSLDPSSEEYMDAYRQVDYMLRKKSATPIKP